MCETFLKGSTVSPNSLKTGETQKVEALSVYIYPHVYIYIYTYIYPYLYLNPYLYLDPTRRQPRNSSWRWLPVPTASSKVRALTVPLQTSPRPLLERPSLWLFLFKIRGPFCGCPYTDSPTDGPMICKNSHVAVGHPKKHPCYTLQKNVGTCIIYSTPFQDHQSMPRTLRGERRREAADGAKLDGGHRRSQGRGSGFTAPMLARDPLDLAVGPNFPKLGKASKEPVR